MEGHKTPRRRASQRMKEGTEPQLEVRFDYDAEVWVIRVSSDLTETEVRSPTLAEARARAAKILAHHE